MHFTENFQVLHFLQELNTLSTVPIRGPTLSFYEFVPVKATQDFRVYYSYILEA